MANKNFWLGILVITLVLGMTVISCDDGSNDSNSGTDSALNGTWTATETNEQVDIGKLKFDNGNFEMSSSGSAAPRSKGTYTTKDGTATVKTTHIHGDAYGDAAASMGLTSKWYTKAELKTALASIIEAGYLTEEYIDGGFLELECGYTVSGNTLTLTMSGQSIAFTKSS